MVKLETGILSAHWFEDMDCVKVVERTIALPIPPTMLARDIPALCSAVGNIEGHFYILLRHMVAGEMTLIITQGFASFDGVLTTYGVDLGGVQDMLDLIESFAATLSWQFSVPILIKFLFNQTLTFTSPLSV